MRLQRKNMSLINLKISWEEDNSTYRSVEILSDQTFYELHTCIKFIFQMPEKMEASMFVSNHKWAKETEISSVVEKNIRGAAALSMKKTPIGALISDPHQKFIYESDHVKKWRLLIEIITLSPVPSKPKSYPVCILSEGVSPTQFGIKDLEKELLVDAEEKFDVPSSEEGYGEEGEEDMNSTDGEDEVGGDDNFTDEL